MYTRKTQEWREYHDARNAARNRPRRSGANTGNAAAAGHASTGALRIGDGGAAGADQIRFPDAHDDAAAQGFATPSELFGDHHRVAPRNIPPLPLGLRQGPRTSDIDVRQGSAPIPPPLVNAAEPAPAADGVATVAMSIQLLLPDTGAATSASPVQAPAPVQQQQQQTRSYGLTLPDLAVASPAHGTRRLAGPTHGPADGLANDAQLLASPAHGPADGPANDPANGPADGPANGPHPRSLGLTLPDLAVASPAHRHAPRDGGMAPPPETPRALPALNDAQHPPAASLVRPATEPGRQSTPAGGFQFLATERRKDEREKMLASDCIECRQVCFPLGARVCARCGSPDPARALFACSTMRPPGARTSTSSPSRATAPTLQPQRRRQISGTLASPRARPRTMLCRILQTKKENYCRTTVFEGAPKAQLETKKKSTSKRAQKSSVAAGQSTEAVEKSE